MDVDERIAQLLQQGYHCSQIMMQLTLDLRQMEEPFVIRSLGGLGGGLYKQRTCGVLTGGVCALSSYVPRGEGEPEPVAYKKMAQDLLEWFEAQHGCIDCGELVEHQMDKIMMFCPGLMASAFEKMLEILEENGIDATEPPPGY